LPQRKDRPLGQSLIACHFLKLKGTISHALPHEVPRLAVRRGYKATRGPHD